MSGLTPSLVETILITKNYQDRGSVVGQAIAEDILGHPIERRRRGGRGMMREKEYLAHHPDRRLGN